MMPDLRHFQILLDLCGTNYILLAKAHQDGMHSDGGLGKM
jgi:hypothetical protein